MYLRKDDTTAPNQNDDRILARHATETEALGETFICRGCGSTYVRGTLCEPCYRGRKISYEERGQ